MKSSISDTMQLAKELLARFQGETISGSTAIDLEIAIADALSDIRFEAVFGPPDEYDDWLIAPGDGAQAIGQS